MDNFCTYKDTKETFGRPQKIKKVFGVGVNDVDYDVYTRGGDGKQVICPFYAKWKKMLERSYYKKCHNLQPTYVGVTVCEEWLKLSDFIVWMAYHDWKGKELDKDLLGDGTLYSPDTCCFILDKTNNFLRTPRKKGRDTVLPIGVTLGGSGKFRATIADFELGRTRHLGTFDTAFEAHIAWLGRKRELAFILADMETDPRVKKALREKYVEPII